MWKYCRTEFTPYWWVIPFGVRVEDCLYRTDIEKELDISILCWHFRFMKHHIN